MWHWRKVLYLKHELWWVPLHCTPQGQEAGTALGITSLAMLKGKKISLTIHYLLLESLYSISLGRRGSSVTWNRWLLFFFEESFLYSMVALSQSKGVSHWEEATTGFLQLSWLRAPLKPAWASAVTNASQEAPRRQIFPRSRDETQMGIRQLQYWKKLIILTPKLSLGFPSESSVGEIGAFSYDERTYLLPLSDLSTAFTTVKSEGPSVSAQRGCRDWK